MTHNSPKRHVLILHGLGGTANTFQSLANALDARGFNSHALTLAKESRTQAMCGGTLSHVGLDGLLAEAKDEALRLVDRAEGQAPIVCGHSNGALLALALAGQGLASHIVLMAPIAPPSVPSGTPRWVQKTFFRLSFGRDWRTGVIRFDKQSRMDPDPPTSEIRQTLIPDSGRALAEAVDLAPGSAFDPAPPLECRCTVIAGEQDRIVPSKVAGAIAARYAADFHVLRGHGHWFPAEAETAKQIADDIVSALVQH